jgi:hypothetical protein
MGVKELLNEIETVATASGNFELRRLSVELKSAIYDLVEENRQLKQDQYEKRSISFKDGAYFVESRDPQWPYCTKCHDTQQKLVLMKDSHVQDRDRSSVNIHTCPNCQSTTGRMAGPTSIQRKPVSEIRRERSGR